VVLSLLLLSVGFVSIVWTPYPIDAINVGAALQEPGAAHWLGTDHLGRDLLSLLMKGTLTSFVVAAIAVAFGAVVGIPLGLVAAHWGGVADQVVLRATGFLFVFPALVTAVLLATVAGPSEVAVMAAVSLVNVPVFARVARGAWRDLKGVDYAAAARLAGLSGWDIVVVHLLPGLVTVLLAQATVQLGVGVLAEATLSYVGLGALPPTASLGLMLKDAQSYALLKPALMLLPGAMIVLIVASVGLAADGIRGTLERRSGSNGADRGAA
jgi:peptide/nickel transport system permease protein